MAGQGHDKKRERYKAHTPLSIILSPRNTLECDGRFETVMYLLKTYEYDRRLKSG
jgi:hypothetical protein